MKNIKISDLFEIINVIKIHFCRVYGIVISSIFFTFIFFILEPKIPLRNLLLSKLGEMEYWKYVFVAYSLLLFILVIIWMVHRQLPKFNQDEIGILFIYSYDHEIQQSINKLIRSIHYQIDQFSYKKIITIKYATPNNIPRDLVELHKKRVRSNAKLIIWGEIYQAKENGDNLISLKRLNFSSATYIVPINPKETRNIFPNISSALAGRKFVINEKHSFTDLDIVSKNISEVSMFIVGILMLIENKFEKANTTLSHLWISIEGKLPKDIFEDNFKKMVKLAYADALAMNGSLIINQNKNNFDALEKMKNSLTMLEKAIRLNPNNSNYYLDLGYVYFQLGDVKKSLKAVRIGKNLAPKNNALPFYSLAFLDMFFGVYIDRALKLYETAFDKIIPHVEQIINIVIFIENCLKKFPDKIFLWLALALINKNKVDSTLALKDFEKFIELCASYTGSLNINKYIDFAKEQIKEIQRKN